VLVMVNDASAYAWAKAARDVEEAIDLSRFPLSLQVQLRPMPLWVEIAVQMRVVDRDAPAPIGAAKKMLLGTTEDVSHDQLEQHARYLLDLGRAKTGPEAWRGALIECALRFVRSVVLHELDECTYVNSERIYDPHVPERRRHDAHP
jgi:hypothetical protein